MIMPYFLWRKQKVYRLVCNRNIESGCDKISNGGGGGLWNWRWQSQYMMIQSQITYLHSCVEQWWVKGRGDKRNWLVHIQQDVIFLSQNFISTSCIANLTWFLAKKKAFAKPYQSILFNGFPRTIIAQAPIYKGGTLIGRRALNLGGRLLRNY